MPCAYADIGDDTFCSYLIFDRNRMATCTLIRDGKVVGRKLGVGYGCILQKLPDDYERYKEEYKEIIIKKSEE